MTPIENLHYALGELAYAVAAVDGKIQYEEREKFKELLIDNLNSKHCDISDIIFKILDKDKNMDSKTIYDWAMKEIKINSHYLSPTLKKKFIEVIKIIARAYPPVRFEEMSLLEKFKRDIKPINGDPLLYKDT